MFRLQAGANFSSSYGGTAMLRSLNVESSHSTSMVQRGFYALRFIGCPFALLWSYLFWRTQYIENREKVRAEFILDVIILR